MLFIRVVIYCVSGVNLPKRRPTWQTKREKQLAERDFVDRASTRKLKCIDSVQTRGNCIRGGKEPQGTNELFRIYDPIRNYNLEYGLGCIEHLIQAYQGKNQCGN